MTGGRVVLVIPRRIDDAERLACALEQIERGGYEVTAVVDPAQHVDAARMVLDGLADLVVVTSPEHFPLVQFVQDLNGVDHRRTRTLLRPIPAEQRPALPRGQRTQVIRRSA